MKKLLTSALLILSLSSFCKSQNEINLENKRDSLINVINKEFKINIQKPEICSYKLDEEKILSSRKDKDSLQLNAAYFSSQKKL